MICEAFGCTPSQARREDVGECLRIIALRSYAHTYALIESPGSKVKDAGGLPFSAEYAANKLADMRGEL